MLALISYVAAPGTSDGFVNVDSFAFFQQADVNKQNAQAMAEILGTSFKKFQPEQGSINSFGYGQNEV